MDYVLKGIPNDLWQRAKIKAVTERISLKEVLLRALNRYVKDEGINDERTNTNR